MNSEQPGILAQLSPLARYLMFSLSREDLVRDCLRAFHDIPIGRETVVGLGESLVLALGGNVAGLRTFPAHAGAAVDVPSTPFALWCWLRGDDRGELFHRARRIEAALSPAFRLEHSIDAFLYGGGRDLTGYEDGTENPTEYRAVEAAIRAPQGDALDGSSFVAVQQWEHDLHRFAAMPSSYQDNVIGRRRADNEEIEEAPPHAHVKRTAQESFAPPAFVVRRSMPWVESSRAGLVFVAFGHSFDAFEAQLQRMVGQDDGIADALFTFTRPILGAYFWCPGIKDGRLNLSVLGV